MKGGLIVSQERVMSELFCIRSQIITETEAKRPYTYP